MASLPPNHPSRTGRHDRRSGERPVRYRVEPEPRPAMLPPIVLEVCAYLLIIAGLAQLIIFWPGWVGAVQIAAGLFLDWRARVARNEVRAAHWAWLAAGKPEPTDPARLRLNGGEVQCSPDCATACPPGQCLLMASGTTPGPDPDGLRGLNGNPVVWEAPAQLPPPEPRG